MKHCPNCNSIYSDTVKFCTKCGTKLENSVACPECGYPLKIGTKFCTNCGAKLDGTTRKIVTNDSPLYECEVEETFFQKNKSVIIIMVITAMIIAAIVGFSMFHGQTDGKVSLSDTVDTAAVDTAAEYDETEGLREDIMSKIEAIQPTNKTIWHLVITKDYTAPCIKEEDEMFNMDECEFRKGEILSENYECYISKTEGGYFVDFGRNGKYFVPKENATAKSYKVTDFPKTILDLAGLRFKNKNGKYLSLFKLIRNGYTYKCYDEVVNKTIYCFKDDSDTLYEYDGEDKEYDSPCSYLMNAEEDSSNKHIVNKYGALQCNIVAGSFNVPVYLFYIPSIKALMYNHDLFILDDILIPEYREI